MLESLKAELAARGFVCDPVLDGNYHRFPRENREDSGWLIGSMLDEKGVATCSYGDWATGEKYFWRSDSEKKYSPEEAAEISKLMEEKRIAAEKEKLDRQKAAALESIKCWDAAQNLGDVPTVNEYLKSKGFETRTNGYGLRTAAWQLIVPCVAWDNTPNPTFYGVQRISPDGSKKFWPGQRIDSCFHALLPDGKSFAEEYPKIYFCEGIATALSIFEAFERQAPVVSCFNAGNLPKVVASFKKQYPSSKFVICADEDILTRRPSGEWYNAGRRAAADASVHAEFAAFPFGNVHTLAEVQAWDQAVKDKKATDFNDLEKISGRAWVRDCIQAQVAYGAREEPVFYRGEETPTPEPDTKDEKVTKSVTPEVISVTREKDRGPILIDLKVERLERALNDKGKPMQPTQQQVAQALREHWGQALIKCGSDVFKYTGTYWQLCEDRDYDYFYKQCAKIAGWDFTASQVRGCLEIFLKGIPHVPEKINLFEPRPDRANFLNGTLHLEFRPKTPEELANSPKGAGPFLFTSLFREHKREDYCTTVLPLFYKPEEQLPENPEFIPALKRIWPDSDLAQESKIKLYEELLGAALVPIFSKVVFVQGRPKTGKSSLLMLFAKLVGEQNLSGIDPSKFGESFHLEPMVNKLVNMVTDIAGKKRIDDSVVKQIVDRPLISINRKGKSIVRARLPGLHAFGCNELPKSVENSEGVYDRRVIILRADTVQRGEGGGGEFAAWLWGRGPEGILKAALRGLKRLLETGGAYTVPEDSVEALKEWALDNDSVLQFLVAVKEGEVKAGSQILSVSESASIFRSDLHAAYLLWLKSAAPEAYSEHANPFGKKIARHGFGVKLSNGRRKWMGIGFVDEDNPKH